MPFSFCLLLQTDFIYRLMIATPTHDNNKNKTKYQRNKKMITKQLEFQSRLPND